MTSSNFALQLNSFSGNLKSFAMSLTKDTSDSEDLVQDTMLRAIMNRDKFENGTNLKAWTMTIMRNIFINNYRKKIRRNTIVDTTDNNYFINSGDRTVVNGGENVLLMQEIQIALKSINSDHSVPFMMYFEGFKYEEIADILELPLGTVKSRIFLARKELKKLLKASRN
ncbi:MAG: RNA polymerase sigma factor [Chitinophagales bacterium]|nr:RNA polymerase sigma factor [Chitinophagales bacterium]